MNGTGVRPVQAPNQNSTSNKGAQNAERVTVFAENLEVPWGMVFLPDGRMLVTERPGRVRMVSKNGVVETNPTATVNIKETGEGGLHGIALDPEFNSNNYVYLYYTFDSSGNESLNRVARYELKNDTLINPKTIVNNIPGAVFHDGGRIAFGPDGHLYITTGDAQQPSLAQNKNSLAGKILRVDNNGKAAPSNPFNNLVYSYGHRNPQGITWDSNGQLFETEHGNSAHDELNKIEAGKNYGWPNIEGKESNAGMVTPIAESETDTWAPGGIAYLNGYFYFAGLRGNGLYKATVNGNTAEITKFFDGEFGRMRNVIVGPDNMLYVATSNRDGRGDPKDRDDKIIRVNPSKL